MLKRFYGSKKGFTLAEVLITLGIIGVVAAMTIPTLIQNTNSVKFASQFKKSISTLSQAALMAQAQYDVDYSLTSSVSSADNCGKEIVSGGNITFCGLLNNTLAGQTYLGTYGSDKVLAANGGKHGGSDTDKYTFASTKVLPSSTEYLVYSLADGSYVGFDPAAVGCGLGAGNVLDEKSRYRERPKRQIDVLYEHRLYRVQRPLPEQKAHSSDLCLVVGAALHKEPALAHYHQISDEHRTQKRHKEIAEHIDRVLEGLFLRECRNYRSNEREFVRLAPCQPVKVKYRIVGQLLKEAVVGQLVKTFLSGLCDRECVENRIDVRAVARCAEECDLLGVQPVKPEFLICLHPRLYRINIVYIPFFICFLRSQVIVHHILDYLFFLLGSIFQTRNVSHIPHRDALYGSAVFSRKKDHNEAHSNAGEVIELHCGACFFLQFLPIKNKIRHRTPRFIFFDFCPCRSPHRTYT